MIQALPTAKTRKKFAEKITCITKRSCDLGYKRAADGTTNRQTFSKTLSEIFVINLNILKIMV